MAVNQQEWLEALDCLRRDETPCAQVLVIGVRGSGATPLYQELAAATGEAPGWNFHKYLVDREGRVVASFGSRTTPDDPKLVAAIEKLLDAPVPARPDRGR